MIEGALDFVIDIAATSPLFLVAVQLPGSSSKAYVHDNAYDFNRVNSP
jgi:hypothetical protein